MDLCISIFGTIFTNLQIEFFVNADCNFKGKFSMDGFFMVVFFRIPIICFFV